MSVMKSLAILVLVGTATTLFADTFTIERNDPRPFRIWNEKPPRPEVCLNLDIRLESPVAP